MPVFDPTLPAANSPVSSGELRDQFNGLKNEIDNLPTTTYVDNAIIAETPATIYGLAPLLMAVADPPTAAQVQAIADKLDALIAALKR